jgi:phospholipid/cholesterol/gamma-HCH transport system substrate-binding protein
MEAEARYTAVGAAVLALLAALIAAVLWLKDVGGRGEFRRYAIHFEQQALDGLQIGADVNLRGIKVGRVQDYALSGDKLNRVRVEVRVDRRTPVRTNTVAVVTRNFVTGIASITLINAEPAGPPLTEPGEGDPLPVIAEGRSNIDQLAGRVTQLGDLATAALGGVNQLLTEENRRAVVDAVRHLRDLSAGLEQRLAKLDLALDRTGQAADSVGTAGERVAAAVESAGRGFGQAAQQTEAALAQARQTLVEGEKMLAEARIMLARTGQSIDRLDRQVASTGRRLEAAVEDVDDQLGAATAELRLSVESVARVLDRLRDPRAAILGPAPAQLGPGEGGR